MTHQDFIDKLSQLAEAEDFLSVAGELKELRSKFEDYVLEEERKQQVAQLEAEEAGESIPEQEGDFGKEEFYTLYSELNTKRKELKDAKTTEETTNLQAKKSLINRLQDVITKEENIGAAFAAFKEIQEKWKTIGDIPRVKRSEIQSDYSRLIEDFFYNINIYKELKDHDFHRNKQLKEEVIDKLKKLGSVKAIKELEQHIKTLQNDWEDIGPVPNEAWETLKDAYWTEVRSVYDRINRHYEDKRNEQKENLAKKEALIVETQSILGTLEKVNDANGWEYKTKAVIDVQDRWKKVGFGPRKENEEIWKRFRSLCDEFFAAKKVFYSGENEKLDAVAAKKTVLIEKAEALKTSNDWKEASNQFIQLQKQWKQLGNSGRRNEQKLWKKFRAACDYFFDAKSAHFNEKDKENENNLTLKNELIEELKQLTLDSDKKTALNQLKDYSSRFNAIGHVPMKEKDTVYKNFKKALDDKYISLKLEGKEKEETLFVANLESMKASPNSSRQFDDLRFNLRKDIDKLQKEIILLENNLGFFANSKGADALKKDVEKKIERAREEMKEIRSKLKMIPNE